MGTFSEVAQENNPASGLFDPVAESPRPKYSDEQLKRTATLGALADIRNAGSDATLDDLIGHNQEMITNGQEDQLRRQKDQYRKDKETAMVRSMQVESLNNNDGFLKDYLMQEQAVNARDDKNALEKEGIQTLQDLATNDPTQAALYKDHLVNGTALDRIRDNIIKTTLYQRELDKLKTEQSEQGTLSDARDLFLSFLPFSQGLIAGHFTSQGVQEDNMKFWNQDVNSFAANLPGRVHDYYNRVYDSPALASRALEQAYGMSDSDAVNFNIWSAIDVGSILPLGLMAKIGKSPTRMLQALGNRRDAARMAAASLATDMAGEGVKAPGISKVVDSADALSTSLPSAVLPKTSDLVQPWIKPTSEIAKDIETIESIGKDAELVTPERLSSGQYDEAIQKKLKDVETDYGPDIVDFKAMDASKVDPVVKEVSKALEARQVSSAEREAQDMAEGYTINAYHGSANADLTSIDMSKTDKNSLYGPGFYTTEDPNVASSYAQQKEGIQGTTAGTGANVTAVRLKIKNPFDINSKIDQAKANEMIAKVKGEPFTGKLQPSGMDVWNELIKKTGGRNSPAAKVKAQEILKEAGYDGLTHVGGDRMGDVNHKVWVAFSSDQVRGRFGGIGDLGVSAESSEASRKITSLLGHELEEDKNVAGVGLYNRLNLVGNGTMTPQEMESAVLGAKGKVQLLTDPNTRIRTLQFYLGKKNGVGGYVSQEAAEKAATRRGMSLDDVAIHQNIDGQWFIRRQENVPEIGIATPELKAADLPTVNRLSSILRNPDNFLQDSLNEARHLSDTARARIQKLVVTPLGKHLDALNQTQRLNLKAMLEISERDQKWMDLSELNANYERMTGNVITDKEVKGYYAAKELNDWHYKVANQYIYTDKVRQGYETVQIVNPAKNIDTGRRNGKVLDSFNLAGGNRVFDLENGVWAKGSEIAAKMEQGNYKVIELEGAFDYSGEPVKHILASKGSFTNGPLEEQQLGYVAGGHRMYKNKWFVKQANSFEFKDGSKGWNNPIVHVAGKTRKQVKIWADEMEAARNAYNDMKLGKLAPSEAERIIANSPVESLAKFDKLVQEGQIHPGHPFEVVYDRGLPDAMPGQGVEDPTFFGDKGADFGTSQYFTSKGRMYYSPKGERLRDPEGELAEILDPYETLSKSIQNAVNTTSFGNHNRRVMEEWVRVAKPYIDTSRYQEGVSPIRLFLDDGNLKPNLKTNDHKLYNTLEEIRYTQKRFLGLQTKEMVAKEQAARTFANWVEEKVPGKAGTWMAGKAMDNMSANPISFVRGVVFDAWMGAFNVGQFFLQTQTALAALSMVGPIEGSRMAANAFWLKRLVSNPAENVLDYTAKKLAPMMDMDVNEYKDSVRWLRKSGWMDVDNNSILYDIYTNSIGGSLIHRSADKLRVGGRFFFYEAEKYNRLAAWQLAWKETREKFPKLDHNSLDFQSKLAQRRADFNMNMTSASKARWQEGAWSIPTQFKSYQARMLENMMPASMGGNPRFSGAQKIRLATSQLAMYGAKGLPLFGWAASEWKQNRGEDLSPDVWRGIEQGFWDNLIYYSTGGDVTTDFASRAGQYEAWDSWFRSLSNGDLASTMENIGGPLYGAGSSLWDAMGRIGTYFKFEQNIMLNKETWNQVSMDVFRNINTLKYAEKAAWIFRTGQIKDPKTGQAYADADWKQGIAALMGIRDVRETERFSMLEEISNRDDEVKQIGQLVANNRRQFFQALEEGDEKKANNIQNIVSGIMMGYRNDPLLQAEIAKEATKNLNYSATEWNSLVMKYHEKLGKKPVNVGPGSQ